MDLPFLALPLHERSEPKCTSLHGLHVVLFQQPLYNRTLDRDTMNGGKRDFAWFSQIKGYGSADSYGRFIHEWLPNRELRLLDVSNEDRADLARVLGVPFSEITCDEQYDSEGNLKFHKRLEPLLHKLDLDGTYAREEPTCTANAETCGPSEVVLLKSKMEKLEYCGLVQIDESTPPTATQSLEKHSPETKRHKIFVDLTEESPPRKRQETYS